VTLGAVTRTPPGAPGFSFAQFCSSDGGLCTPTTFASLSSSPTDVAAPCGG
jgi:hypothetical protein